MGVVPPKEGFLEFLREITLKYETVLIFDEVITGFRLGFGGAQEYFGVKPDMTTLGKIVGGGMPIAAYGGRKEIMDRVSPTGPVYQAGTLSGNPIATTAGIETLKILKAHPEYYKKIDESAKKIADAYRKMAEEKSIPLHVNQIGSLLSAFQTGETVDDYDSALTSDTKHIQSISGRCLTMEFMLHRHSLKQCLCLLHIQRKILKELVRLSGYEYTIALCKPQNGGYKDKRIVCI